MPDATRMCPNGDVLAALDSYVRCFPEDGSALSALGERAAGRGDVRSRADMSGHVTASALILDTTRRTMLLVLHRHLKMWLQPGGHCEPGEEPWRCALREAVEETGVTDLVLAPWHHRNGCPIDIDSHWIPANPGKGEDRHLHHDFRYVFLWTAPDSGGIRLDADEVSGFRLESLACLPGSLQRAGRRLSTCILPEVAPEVENHWRLV